MVFPLKLARRVRLKKGPVLLGTPQISANRIYLGWQQIHRGVLRGEFVRIDAEDCRIVWSKKYDAHKPVAPFLMFENVLLLIGPGIMAVDPLSGDELWSRNSAGVFPWRDQLLTLDPHSVVILDPATGTVLDRMELPGKSWIHGFAGDTLLYGIGEGLAVTAAYGLTERKLLWKRPLLEESVKDYKAPGESMTLAGGTKAFVFAKANVGVFGCSMEDGHILWHQRAFVSSDVPIAINGRVYLLTEDFTPARQEFPKFICFDELTGERIYETEHKEFRAYRPSRPSVCDDHIYFGSNGGFVFAFRLSDGELVWRHRTTGQTWQPTVFENRLYVTSDDGHLLVFEGKKSPTKTKARTEHG
jgi:outer membrane protein assembly factor BamB